MYTLSWLKTSKIYLNWAYDFLSMYVHVKPVACLRRVAGHLTVRRHRHRRRMSLYFVNFSRSFVFFYYFYCILYVWCLCIRIILSAFYISNIINCKPHRWRRATPHTYHIARKYLAGYVAVFFSPKCAICLANKKNIAVRASNGLYVYIQIYRGSYIW